MLGSVLNFCYLLPETFCSDTYTGCNTFCWVLQAFVLKYILFFPNELGKVAPGMSQNLGSRRLSKSQCVSSNNFASLTEDVKAR